jgi:hypothetical protein
VPEATRIAPTSAASVQTFAHGGQVHEGRRADAQRAFQWVRERKPSISRAARGISAR